MASGLTVSRSTLIVARPRRALAVVPGSWMGPGSRDQAGGLRLAQHAIVRIVRYCAMSTAASSAQSLARATRPCGDRASGSCSEPGGVLQGVLVHEYPGGVWREAKQVRVVQLAAARSRSTRCVRGKRISGARRRLWHSALPPSRPGATLARRRARSKCAVPPNSSSSACSPMTA